MREMWRRRNNGRNRGRRGVCTAADDKGRQRRVEGDAVSEMRRRGKEEKVLNTPPLIWEIRWSWQLWRQWREGAREGVRDRRREGDKARGERSLMEEQRETDLL